MDRITSNNITLEDLVTELKLLRQEITEIDTELKLLRQEIDSRMSLLESKINLLESSLNALKNTDHLRNDNDWLDLTLKVRKVPGFSNTKRKLSIW